MKTIFIATAFSSLLFATAPLSARVDGPKDLRDADRGCPTAVRSGGAKVKLFDGTTGPERAAPGAALPGGKMATEGRPPRSQTTNNLKQVGLANNCEQ
ncbi:hypothetical protein G4G27_07475 [Sphingomonas sp. So64.6b]|uniref:hypothetical protein n=1 Tax=Sphingomonas sp. So64.6b TaxID=2997354 RepID=UPI0015FFFFC0|nr:hypothetical protein [Sphingomonas sp. So64.6b]QNA83842.1 hypothetical protein G4G27_07475 [Sphingomonas sp. So64.6b]